MYGKVEGGGARGEATDVSCACGVCLPELPELCVCVQRLVLGRGFVFHRAFELGERVFLRGSLNVRKLYPKIMFRYVYYH